MQFFYGMWSQATGKRYIRQTVIAARTLTRNVFNGAIYDNAGATGPVPLTLPGGGQNGDTFTFFVKAAQALQVIPQAGASININGSVQTAGHGIANLTVGGSVTLVRDSAGNWDAIGVLGSWTVL